MMELIQVLLAKAPVLIMEESDNGFMLIKNQNNPLNSLHQHIDQNKKNQLTNPNIQIILAFLEIKKNKILLLKNNKN